ncbi:hypothetical protein Fmac_029518 [Flemingia macrophylla]|uniref:COMM domain-containing protein n=1 Tax=Flemingia macrophylla TaxID=520843 RepID=A0ABD1LAJ9_9FABA
MVEKGAPEELEKLSQIESEEGLELMVRSLWSTRKTGLSLSDKSRFQSLLHLASPSQLDPLLACLRCLLRKCAHHNLARDDLLKLFPPDLPPQLRTSLLSALHANRDRWKEDASVSPPPPPPPHQLEPNVASSMLWPRYQQDADLETPPPTEVPPCFQCRAASPSQNSEYLPSLKSITWTMESRGSSPADRVAIISLKLHDYNKSPSGETEVKFQLTRDTLEAMLRSMTYIREQLNAVGTSSGPANKKQKQ